MWLKWAKVGVAFLVVCVMTRSATAQIRAIARELSAAESAKVLHVPSAWLERLGTGGTGPNDSVNRAKERLSEGQVEQFVEQFGRLRNDMPTFQIAPDKYYVLIPLPEFEKQPAGDGVVRVAAQPLVLRQPGAPGVAEATVRPPGAAPPPPQAKNQPAGEGQGRVVDHRNYQTPIRDQGHRGTCVAFASCAELESILRRAGQDRVLCTNLAYHLFMKEEGSTPCNDPGLATWKAAGYLKKHLVGEETKWPYVGTDPTTLVSQGTCSSIDQSPMAFQGETGYGIADFLLLPASTEVLPDGTVDIRDTLTLERLLDEGRSIVFGTIVAWNTAAAQGVIDVKLGPSGQPIFGAGGHAMLIVGYNKPAEGAMTSPYFIVKNSWGTNYGHQGYLHMSYDYIRCYARYGYTTINYKEAKIQ